MENPKYQSTIDWNIFLLFGMLGLFVCLRSAMMKARRYEGGKDAPQDGGALLADYYMQGSCRC